MKIVLPFLLGLQMLAQTTPQGEMTPQMAMKFMNRIDARESFLDSGEAKKEPQSLYKFFHKKEYFQLKGNPVIGYYNAEKFLWEGNRVCWQGIKPVTADAKPIRAEAWNAAFKVVAKLRGLVNDPNAPIKIQGACVGAVLEPSLNSPFRGVCIEIKITSPTGTYFHRYSVGKPDIENAIAASLDWVFSFAKEVNKQTEVPKTAKKQVKK